MDIVALWYVGVQDPNRQEQGKKQDHNYGFRVSRLQSLQTSPWKKDTSGNHSGGKSRPEELVDIQGSPPPSSRKVHLNKKEIKQSLQEAHMDKQGTPNWTQTKFTSTGSMEKWPRRNIGLLSHLAGTGLRKWRTTWCWIWQGHANGNKKEFYTYIISKRETRETMDLLLNGVRELVTNHTGNVKVLDAIFACLVW